MPRYATRRNSSPRNPGGRFSLEGMLQAHAGQIRLVISLVDNEEGTIVWSENFDRRVTDPLALQSEIAVGAISALEDRVVFRSEGATDGRSMLSPIVRGLRRRLGLAAGTQVEPGPTQSNPALDSYMRGYALLEEVSEAGTQNAIRYFDQAIRDDASFALAHAALSEAYIALVNYHPEPDVALFQKARSAAADAVRQDPNLAESHAIQGAVRQLDWEWQTAEQSFREALRLKPRFAKARRWLTDVILASARNEEATGHARQALRDDPFNPVNITGCGLYIFFAGHYEEAISILAPAVEGNERPGTRHNLGQVYAQIGYETGGAGSDPWFERAFAEARAVASIEQRTAARGDPWPNLLADSMFGLFHAMRGDRARTEPYLQRLLEAMRAGRASPVTIAWIYSVRGEFDAAFRMLELALAMRDRRLHLIKVNPWLAPLRGDPRFESLRSKLRL